LPADLKKINGYVIFLSRVINGKILGRFAVDDPISTLIAYSKHWIKGLGDRERRIFHGVRRLLCKVPAEAADQGW
jgi:hypothetical protein